MTGEGVCEGMWIVGSNTTGGGWVGAHWDSLRKILYHYVVAELRRADKYASKRQCTCWFRAA